MTAAEAFSRSASSLNPPGAAPGIVFATLHRPRNRLSVATRALLDRGYQSRALSYCYVGVVLSTARREGRRKGFAVGAKTMGTVITFPAARRAERASERQIAAAGATATIMILPVIRIERMIEAPDDGLKRSPAGRKRRRRARQS